MTQRGAAQPLPIVLKAATDLSSGAGADVAICRTIDDLAAARERFAGCKRLVVESCQSILRNLCLHYAVMPDGTTRTWVSQTRILTRMVVTGATGFCLGQLYRANWSTLAWRPRNQVRSWAIAA